MKPTALLIPTALLLMLSCTHNDPTPITVCPDPSVSLSGLVSYGQGDCMPGVDLAKRSYNLYNGEVYLLRKAALDQLGNGDFAQLKGASPHYPVRDGKLTVSLPADTYVVMLDNFYSNENIVTITMGQNTHQDFKFWQCMSY